MAWTRTVSNLNSELEVEVTDGYIQSTGVRWFPQHPPVGGRTREASIEHHVERRTSGLFLPTVSTFYMRDGYEVFFVYLY